ncbi:heparan sulfate 3-O sulfotransferase-A isoform X2 [Haematobia irritans]|uniref:heparan sulfate 3-O sulfotransferase-A isoform X2 n=1 Tax=Haematobia irritans TaxID=7368 RepID=UPI003F4F82F7
MTAAKRRTGSNSATFVADNSNNHYTSLDQQQHQQQQQQHQQPLQHLQEPTTRTQSSSQHNRQFFNSHRHQHNRHLPSNQHHEHQHLLQQEPQQAGSSVTSSLSSIGHNYHYQQRYPSGSASSSNYGTVTSHQHQSPSNNQTTPAAATSSSSSSSSTASSIMRGECSVKLPLDILWLPKSAMRPVGPDTSHTDCILVVGVSRPKLAVVFLTVMLISLFLTFHVLYDSAVYNIQAAQAVHEHHHRLALINSNSISGFGGSSLSAGGGSGNGNRFNHLPEDYTHNGKHTGDISSLSSSSMSSSSLSSSSLSSSSLASLSSPNQQISHPMVFPSNRVHFPKTSRRLPQALIIGIRKCGTRALLEMLYLHPRIQKAGGEVHFFDRDENYMKGLEWYRKKMPHSFRGQITIEKSPSYFVSPEVPERVRAMNASIKLLLIVREPVTRAISDYTQLRSHAATATLPLANAVNEYQQQQQQQSQQHSQPQQSNSPAASSSSQNSGKISTHSMLYSKLNAGYSSSQTYDNFIGGGGGPGSGGGGRIGAGGGYVYGSGAGGIKANSNSKIRQYDGTTTPSPSLAAAQILSKSFEELAIFPNGTVNESYRPLTISMYHLHLHRWLEVFPREQILIVNGDRLIDDPVSQLKKIETFLGIEHRITSNHFYFNETKGFYCLRYDSGDRCLRETKGRKHPHVDPVVISKLRKFFAEHNQRFYELVGEDLGWPEE